MTYAELPDALHFRHAVDDTSSRYSPAFRAHAFAVVALTAFAAFSELGRRSLWYDELYSVVSAATSTSLRELLVNWGVADPHPPGYAILLFSWFRVAPATEMWARLPNAVIATAVVGYLLFATNVRLAPGARLYAALLYGTGSATLYYAQTARQYELLLAGTLFAVLELLRVSPNRPRSRGSWIRLSLFLLLTSYVHYFGVLVWIAVTLTAIVREGRNPPCSRDRVYAVLAFFVLYLPGWFWLYRTADIAGGQERVAFTTFVGEYFRYVFYEPPALTVALAAVLLVIPAARHRDRLALVAERWIAAGPVRLLALALTVLLVELVTLAVFRPVLQLRYGLILYPPLLLLVALWCETALPFTTRVGKACLWATVCIGMANYHAYRQTDKQDWRRSAEYVKANARPDDRIYVLGADPTVKAADYLARGDLDGYFSCRNLWFYRFYFDRLQAADLAGRLRHLDVDYAASVAELTADDAPTTFILGGHHLTLSEGVLASLGEHFIADELWMRSTVVYRLTRKRSETETPDVLDDAAAQDFKSD